MSELGDGPPPTSPLPVQAEPPQPEDPRPRTPKRRRRVAAIVLAVVAAIFVPLAMSGLWARAMIGDTGTYLNAVAPMATDPAVTAALQERVTDAVMDAVDQLDVTGQVQDFLTKQGVPGRLANLISAGVAGLNDSLRAVVSRAVTGVVEDPRFGTTWEALNRAAHRALVGVLDGDSALLDADGNLSLQLRPVIDAVRQRLADNGQSWVALLPATVNATWVLLPADRVNALRDTVNMVRATTIELAILALLAVIGAVLIAPDRAQGLARTALGLTIGAVGMLAALRYGTHVAVGAFPHLQHPDAIAAMIRSITAALVTALRWLFVISVVAAIIAALLGRGERATRARARMAGFRNAMVSPPYSGPRRVVAAVLAAGCALALVLIDAPSSVAIGALLLGVLIGGVLALLPGAGQQLPPTPETAAPRERETAAPGGK